MKTETPVEKLRRMHLLTIMTALFVVGLGAYTRLEHAGLGCPDWPKCYHNWFVHPQIATPALSINDTFKAWLEMIHRYAAGLLCIGILLLNIYRKNKDNTLILRFIALCTILQAAFGMWTVTWRLHPLAVMPHLIGGMTITALLTLDYRNQYASKRPILTTPTTITTCLRALMVVLWLQIILGGWTSANYAALVCPDFPTCQGKWGAPLHYFIQGFTAPFGFRTYEGGVLSGNGRIAIHIAHRFGAFICTVIMSWLITQVYQWRHQLTQQFIRKTQLLTVLFIVQIALGILNVVWTLPISTALLHNLVALGLLLQVIVLLTQKSQLSKINHSHTAHFTRHVPTIN